MSRLTVFVCVLMLIAAVVSVDVPSSPKPGHDQPDLKHPIDMHKHHDPAMQHQEPPKMPDPKDMKNFQDMQAQGKS